MALSPTTERQAQRAGEAEGMEERQHADHPVILLHPQDLGDGLEVGDDIVLREHDALGLARGAWS